MKKFLSAALIALVVSFAAYCSADSVTNLNPIIGNWYDAKGNLVLTISNDYKINGCTIVSINYGADMAASYKIRIDEGNRYRDIELSNSGFDYHEQLTFNKTLPLRRTKEPRYFESIGGIYLGMNKDEVLKRYGQPSRYGKYYHNAEYWENVWKYDKEGFDVMIHRDVVIMIVMYKHGNRRFDWSGLSANNSKADFAYKYNNKVGRRGGILIGHGEIIFICDDAVELRLYYGGPT